MGSKVLKPVARTTAPTSTVSNVSVWVKSMALRSAHTSTQVFLQRPVRNSMQASWSMTTTCGTAWGKEM